MVCGLSSAGLKEKKIKEKWMKFCKRKTA